MGIRVSSLISRLQSSPIGIRLLKGGAWSLGGNIISRGIVLVSTIIVAHILGKSGYGEYSIIKTTIFMFVALASLGVGAVATKYISQFRDSNLQKAYNIYIISNIFVVGFALFTCLLVYFSSEWLAAVQLDNASLDTTIKYGSVLLFFSTINGAQAGALAGFENFKKIAFNTFLASIVEVVAVSVLAYIYGVNGAIIGSGISYAVLAVINLYTLQNCFKGKVLRRLSLIKYDEVSTIWKFGVPAALCNLLVIIALWLSRTYLVRHTDFGQIAEYNAADQIKTFVLFIPSALSTIILPILTNVKHSGDDGSTYQKVLKYNIIVNVGISTIIAIIISVFAKQLLLLWGKDFSDYLPLIILVISAIFTSFATVVGQAIASQGKMWAGFVCNLIWAALVISFSYYFVDKGYGATGLALAILFAYILHGAYQYLYLRIILIKS